MASAVRGGGGSDGRGGTSAVGAAGEGRGGGGSDGRGGASVVGAAGEGWTAFSSRSKIIFSIAVRFSKFSSCAGASPPGS